MSLSWKCRGNVNGFRGPRFASRVEDGTLCARLHEHSWSCRGWRMCKYRKWGCGSWLRASRGEPCLRSRSTVYGSPVFKSTSMPG